jgi:nicotinamidase-related amidase
MIGPIPEETSMSLYDRAVLVPIDMQRAFDDAPWPKRWNSAVDENGRALLAAWRAAKRPIIHVRHDSVVQGSTMGPGAPGNAFRPGFEPLDGEPVVSKSVNSAFIGTDLDLRLRRLGVDTVVTFGISTDMCVSTTVRVGANTGWRMVLVGDACDCFELTDPVSGATIPAEQMHRAHLATLAFEFAEVVNTADVTAALKGAANAA